MHEAQQPLDFVLARSNRGDERGVRLLHVHTPGVMKPLLLLQHLRDVFEPEATSESGLDGILQGVSARQV